MAGLASIICGLPCIGFYMYPVAAIWWMVCAAIMLASAHKIEGWRAGVAACAFPTLVILAIAASLTYFFVSFVPTTMARANAAAARAAAASTGAPSVQKVDAALLAYHASQGEPPHAIKLVIDLSIFSTDFDAHLGPPAPGAQAVSGIALTDIQKLSDEAKDALLARAIAAMRPEVSGVHRIGEFVFCYKGAFGRPEPEAGGLWIVIAARSDLAPAIPALPAATPAGGNPWVVRPPSPPAGTWIVGRADGTIQTIGPANTAAALSEQNDLRKSLGLSALLDPATVRQHSDADESASPGPRRTRGADRRGVTNATIRGSGGGTLLFRDRATEQP